MKISSAMYMRVIVDWDTVTIGSTESHYTCCSIESTFDMLIHILYCLHVTAVFKNEIPAQMMNEPVDQ